MKAAIPPPRGIRPVVDQVFPLSETAAAHARLEAREQFGKIVLVSHERQ